MGVDVAVVLGVGTEVGAGVAEGVGEGMRVAVRKGVDSGGLTSRSTLTGLAYTLEATGSGSAALGVATPPNEASRSRLRHQLAPRMRCEAGMRDIDESLDAY